MLAFGCTNEITAIILDTFSTSGPRLLKMEEALFGADKSEIDAPKI